MLPRSHDFMRLYVILSNYLVFMTSSLWCVSIFRSWPMGNGLTHVHWSLRNSVFRILCSFWYAGVTTACYCRFLKLQQFSVGCTVSCHSSAGWERITLRPVVLNCDDGDYQSSLVIYVKFGVSVNGPVVLIYMYVLQARCFLALMFLICVSWVKSLVKFFSLTSVCLSRCMCFTNTVLIVKSYLAWISFLSGVVTTKDFRRSNFSFIGKRFLSSQKPIQN